MLTKQLDQAHFPRTAPSTASPPSKQTRAYRFEQENYNDTLLEDGDWHGTYEIEEETSALGVRRYVFVTLMES